MLEWLKDAGVDVDEAERSAVVSSSPPSVTSIDRKCFYIGGYWKGTYTGGSHRGKLHPCVL